MFAAELQLARPSDFGSTRLRTGIAAGSPVPPALMKDIQQIFRMNGLTNTYGMQTPELFLSAQISES
jgi:long-chain acyl-CoA synthetase